MQSANIRWRKCSFEKELNLAIQELFFFPLRYLNNCIQVCGHMDSRNLYHLHQLQQRQLAGYPLFTGVQALHDWNPSMTSEEEYYYKGEMKRIFQNNISSEELWKSSSSIDTFPLMNSSMFQNGHQSSNEQLDYKNSKGYISNDYFLKMKDTNGLSNSLFKESYFKQEQHHVFDLNENLLSEDHSYMNNAKTCIGFSGLAAAAATPNYISSHLEHSDFQDLKKLGFNGLNFKNSIGDHSTSFGHFCTDRMSSGFAGLQELIHNPSNSSNKNPVVSNNIGVSTKAKRLSCSAENPAQEVSKKPRITSQSSTPMLKVRKEKLGHRISALHRLVAPFGKTDTASVLTEAIGYIQFLQDQILTLSMPYAKSSKGKLHQINLKDSSIDMKGQAVQDLKSRGLCLVPMSFSSYITYSCD
ncbi:transcription factor bHLH110-like [Nicotiana tomentosiformis]|uniref:transcription factor bHLH110-like n=1 Tax=Nicotiana tomentosiformis TaxID=4098 RepID=UPI00051C1FAF|nr:transcription factor bHLH110-like [Nicotiana tomentosiformis]